MHERAHHPATPARRPSAFPLSAPSHSRGLAFPFASRDDPRFHSPRHFPSSRSSHHHHRGNKHKLLHSRSPAMAACPAATTARIGAPFATVRPSRGTTTKARAASGLRQVEGPVSERAWASSSPAPTHKVTVHDRQRGVVHEFVVPQDQYILHTAEAQDISLPFACRHGCCTSCAVRIKSGEIRQPEALGISAELKDKGYALLSTGSSLGDISHEDLLKETIMHWSSQWEMNKLCFKSGIVCGRHLMLS
uniref:2Fe-2S ferredoxin-type domain-containing protein n=1 Tax=Leersia perrieri TaxID=77586 RepID=A0A0D9VXJ7_9ORYZ